MASGARYDDHDEEESFTAWPLVITIGLAKLATILVVIAIAWDGESLVMVGATIVPWLVVSVGLLSAPIAWHIRLHRVRRRRTALQRAEWSNEGPTAPTAPQPGGTVRR